MHQRRELGANSSSLLSLRSNNKGRTVCEQHKLKDGPSGLFGATHNRPSWASMIERQIDRPSPIPPDL